MTIERILFSLFLFFLVLTGVLPILLLVGAIGVYRYSRYLEIFFVCWFFELLYGTGVWDWPFPFPVLLSGVGIYFFVKEIHARVR